MASNTIPKNRKSAATPVATKLVRYTDGDRDFRDCITLDAINAAILLLDHQEPGLATGVLLLARDRLEAPEKFIAEVARG